MDRRLHLDSEKRRCRRKGNHLSINVFIIIKFHGNWLEEGSLCLNREISLSGLLDWFGGHWTTSPTLLVTSPWTEHPSVLWNLHSERPQHIVSRNVKIKQPVVCQGDRKLLSKTKYGSGELGEDHFDTKPSRKTRKIKSYVKKGRIYLTTVFTVQLALIAIDIFTNTGGKCFLIFWPLLSSFVIESIFEINEVRKERCQPMDDLQIDSICVI